MAIKLGNTPKTFKKIPVKFTMPDGEAGAIAVVFKYRSRSGYGAYLNELFNSAETEQPVDEDAKRDFVAIFAKGGEKAIEKLLAEMESWDFGYELNKETLMQMQDEFPASIAALGEAFRAACVEGKLGT